MLETYYVEPQTVDRVRASWIGPEVERYVSWLAEHGYAARSVLRRVPLLVAFGQFASATGARVVGDLPAHVDAFVAERVARHQGTRRGGATERQVAKEIRGPVEQMLAVVVLGFVGQRPSAWSGAVRRQGPRVLRVPGLRAWPPARIDPQLPAPPDSI